VVAKVFPQNVPEVLLRRAIRRPVVVRQVEVCHAPVERSPDAGPRLDGEETSPDGRLNAGPTMDSGKALRSRRLSSRRVELLGMDYLNGFDIAYSLSGYCFCYNEIRR
jgi:hypothetical protein